MPEFARRAREVRGFGKTLLVLVLALGLVAGACAPKAIARSSAASPPAPEPAIGAPVEDEDDGPAESDDEDDDGDREAVREPAPVASPCPSNMALVATDGLRFCVDIYEASLVEVDGDGDEKPFPHWLPVDGHSVRAVSEPEVFPQAFISEVQAEDACAASGKRLCTHGEWKAACMGPTKTTFPYGDTRQPGTCHDTGKSAVVAVFGARAMTDPVASAPPSTRARRAGAKTTSSRDRAGAKTAKPGRKAHVTTKGRAAETTRRRAARPGGSAKAERPRRRKADKATAREKAGRSTKRATAKVSARPVSVEPSVWTQLNDPRLGQVEGALAKTGAHDACVNGYGVLDMVGNLHEWVKTDPSTPNGTFAGGYFLDTTRNGDGCHYRTTAHAHDYHDYSTGFRCCAEPKDPPEPPSPE